MYMRYKHKILLLLMVAALAVSCQSDIPVVPINPEIPDNPDEPDNPDDYVAPNDIDDDIKDLDEE